MAALAGLIACGSTSGDGTGDYEILNPSRPEEAARSTRAEDGHNLDPETARVVSPAAVDIVEICDSVCRILDRCGIEGDCRAYCGAGWNAAACAHWSVEVNQCLARLCIVPSRSLPERYISEFGCADAQHALAENHGCLMFN